MNLSKWKGENYGNNRKIVAENMNRIRAAMEDDPFLRVLWSEYTGKYWKSVPTVQE